jgi:hydrogenase maturation protein HypF
MSLTRFYIKVFGSVQGVGFRPFVYRVANELNLKGYVLNGPQGVVIEVESPKEVIYKFLIKLQKEKPPLAHIYSLEYEEKPPKGYKTFEIK